eukprot:TRINITY_DN7276_c0_g2_i1.p1 TRINITY_DN7276_c0_g2~~TRINITY_DN7276_c0_g2_i1.p1  ORF type:complete len:972 (-),score=162.16 TRINITY_DN7276_c0_g2_i1:135-3050(-)
MELHHSIRSIAPDAKHTLKLTIVGATKLRNADFKPTFGESDPYVVCEIKGKKGTSKKTPTKWNELNPVWDYVTEIENFCIGDTLLFNVWDKDIGKPDDFLGSCELRGETFLEHGFKGNLPLIEKGKETEAMLNIEIVTPLQGTRDSDTVNNYRDIDESFLTRGIFDEEWEHHGASRLTRSSLNTQYWALGFCIISLPVVIWASSNSLSCVYLNEHETGFLEKSCPNIAESARALPVPDFCWKPCMQNRTLAIRFYLLLAMVMQAIVVISNHKGCNRWAQVTITSDFYHKMDEIDDLLEQEMDQDKIAEHKKEVADNMGRMQRFVFQKFMTQVMVHARTLKNSLMAKARKSSSTNTGMTFLQARYALQVARICVFLAALMVGFLASTSYSMYSSFLRCSSKTLTLTPSTSWFHLSALALVAGLLVLTLYLQLCGKWTAQFKLQGDRHNRQSIKELKKQFTKKYYVQHWKALSSKYKALQSVHFKELLWVEHDKYMDPPDGAFGCKEWRGEVVLHFKVGRSLRDLLWIDNKHRLAAVVILFVGAVALNAASHQCWTCVRGITAKEHVTGTQMEQLLLLLGACGRHSGVGPSCQIAAVAMLIAWVQQMLVIWLSDAKFRGGHSVQSAVSANEEHRQHHQLWLRLCSINTDAEVNYDPAKFQEAGAAMPEFYCHTWVQVAASTTQAVKSQPSTSSTASPGKRKGSKGDAPAPAPTEIVTNCVDGSTSSRASWCRSKLPRLVELQEAPQDAETVSAYIKGLVRDEYGPPSVCIRIRDESGDDKTQMVPPQFVGGHGVGVWMNLGPKLGWEKLSAGCGFVAFCLALCDLAYYLLSPRGMILSRCNDVLNDRCEDFHIKSKWHHSADQLEFRSSSGCALACFGAACALAACLCMRVASIMEGRYAPVQVVSEYGKAILSTFTFWFEFIRFVFESLWQCLSERVRSQFCAQAQADDNDTEIGLLAADSVEMSDGNATDR